MKIFIGIVSILGVGAFAPLNPGISNSSLLKASPDEDHDSIVEISRRSAIDGLSTVAAITFFAGLAPAASNAADAPAPDGEPQFVELANGVKVKDFMSGSGDTVNADSQVQIQASGRLLNLNGVIFYNTRNNHPDLLGAIPLTINLGKGEALPGLESGLIGMKKGGIRRILVPADLAYSGFPNLEPKPTNSNDQRALDSVVKNPNRDATILFDVSVERFR